MDDNWIVAPLILVAFILFGAGLWVVSRLFGDRCWRCRQAAIVRLNRMRFARPVAGIYLCRNCGSRGIKFLRP